MIAQATLALAMAPKEKGVSPEFPDHPRSHMPRPQTPVVSCPRGLTRTRLLHQRATQTLLKAGHHVVAFGYAKQISTKDQLLSK